jgi:hypothetical protein
MRYLNDFLVVEEGGVVLFSHSSASGHITDDALFAGFLEAITTFFEMAIRDRIVDINGEETRISFYIEKNLLFVGIAPINKPKASCTKELRSLAALFLSTFKSQLTIIDSKDLIMFEDFRESLI